MSRFLRSTLNPSYAVVLIVLAHPGSLLGQQLALRTSPELFAASSDMVSMQPFSAPAVGGRTVPGSSAIASSAGAIAPVVLVAIPDTPAEPVAHHFWDRQNRTLFAVNAALAGADFFTTRRNLDHNGTELNPVTRVFSGSTPGLAANFVMEAGGVIGVSYLFHKTGHHKLERMTSYVNLGASAFAVSYGLAHR